MMMGYGNSMGWLGMGFGMIINLAFAALIIMAVMWLFKEVFRGGHRQEKSTGVLEILKERYARGEITSEEYQHLKNELK